MALYWRQGRACDSLSSCLESHHVSLTTVLPANATSRRLSHTKAGTPPQAVVKISFVAPGPGSMVLRRKTALHETGVAAASNRPTWDAAVEQQFKLAVSPPIDPSTGAENWGTLQGDLLFQLLHVKGGKRKVFAHQ